MTPMPRIARALRRLVQRLATGVASTLLLAALAPACAQAAEPQIAGYDFDYLSAGDAGARPVQVFDDGRHTFFQFRPGAPVPAIFGHRSGVPELLAPLPEGPYVKVAGLHGRLLLQAGRAQAQVLHAGGGRPDAPALLRPDGDSAVTVASTASGPAAQLLASLAPVPLDPLGAPRLVDAATGRNSYATPRKGDAMQWAEEGEAEARESHPVWFARGSAVLRPEPRRTLLALARSLPPGSRVLVMGREDDSDQEGLERLRAAAMREALLQAGVPAAGIRQSTGPVNRRQGPNRDSTVVVEPASTRAAPAAAATAVADTASAAHLQALVRAGVLRLAQAEAIARTAPSPVPPGASPAVRAAAAAGTYATPSQAAAAAPLAVAWDMRRSDLSIEGTIGRWAGVAGWTLVVDDVPVVAITGELQLPATDFLGAVDTVVRQAQAAGHPIRATAFSNQTLVLGRRAPPSAEPAP
jgi:hypothetical protein